MTSSGGKSGLGKVSSFTKQWKSLNKEELLPLGKLDKHLSLPIGSNYIFQQTIVDCHVSLWECTYWFSYIRSTWKLEVLAAKQYYGSLCPWKAVCLQVLQKKVDLSRSGAKILGEFVMSAEKDWTQPKLEMTENFWVGAKNYVLAERDLFMCPLLNILAMRNYV